VLVTDSMMVMARREVLMGTQELLEEGGSVMEIMLHPMVVVLVENGGPAHNAWYNCQEVERTPRVRMAMGEVLMYALMSKVEEFMNLWTVGQS